MPAVVDNLVSLTDTSLLDVTRIKPPKAVKLEPDEAGVKRWTCDPRYVSILLFDGKNIPYSKTVFFSAASISWSNKAGEPPFTKANPGGGTGGPFEPYLLNSLIFGIGLRFIGGKHKYGFDSKRRLPVWIAVNDKSYKSNTGKLVVELTWR